MSCLKIVLFLLITFCFSFSINAQVYDENFVEQKELKVFADVEWYGAGFLFGVGASYNPFNTNTFYTFKLGYNSVNRTKFPFIVTDRMHISEKGGGLGLSIGYEKLLGGGFKGAFFGIRGDLYQMKIDWKSSGGQFLSGTTRTTLFQPILELGYQFDQSEKYYGRVFVGLGNEVYLRYEGERVGQVLVFLIGVQGGIKYKQ